MNCTMCLSCCITSCFALTAQVKSRVFSASAQPTGILESPCALWFNGISALLILSPAFCLYLQSHTHQPLFEVPSDMILTHSSHFCLAYVVQPGMKSGAPHTLRAFRLQNDTLSRREMLEPRSQQEVAFPVVLCSAILGGTTRVCSLRLDVFILPYLSAASEPLPPACEMPLILPCGHQLPEVTYFTCQHIQEWQQHYLIAAVQTETITLAGTKTEMDQKSHRLCCCIATVLQAGSCFALLSLTVLLLPKQETLTWCGWEQPGHQHTAIPPSLPSSPGVHLFGGFSFRKLCSLFLTLISHHFPLI